MFEIEYKGANSVIVSNKNVSFIFNPKLSGLGLRDISGKGQVEISTNTEFSLKDPEARLVIDGPGEYGVAEADVRGMACQSYVDKTALSETVYTISIGDVKIGVIGNINPSISDSLLEEIGILDILVIPVGGGGITLNGSEAASIVRSIGPRVVIPVHYQDGVTKYPEQQEDLDVFVKSIGAEVESVPKYKLKKSSELPVSLTVLEIARS